MLCALGWWGAGCGASSQTEVSFAPPRAPLPKATPAGLAVGLTEQNPQLLFSTAARPHTPAGFRAARALLAALHPSYLRLFIDWAELQPAPGRGPELAGARDGCLRGRAPCAAYAGLRDELAAIASQQRAGAGWIPVIYIYGVPAWAALPANGCERAGVLARSRPIGPAGLSAYRRLVRSLLALARAEGLALPYMSPWNEPNHPYFLSPQRASCSRGAPLRSPATYAALVRAMGAELAADGPGHEMVLGELAGFGASSSTATGVEDFVGALPDDVICASSIFSVHGYVVRGRAVSAADPVTLLERALDRRGRCGRDAQVWVTETGAGAPDPGRPRRPGAADQRAGCRALAGLLARWSADPRVSAAFQYSFREDSSFPVGLIDAGLTRPYPAYYLWRAWSARQAGGPPPALPRECLGAK